MTKEPKEIIQQSVEEFDYFRLPKGSDKVIGKKRFPDGLELELEAQSFDLSSSHHTLLESIIEKVEGMLKEISWSKDDLKIIKTGGYNDAIRDIAHWLRSQLPPKE